MHWSTSVVRYTHMVMHPRSIYSHYCVYITSDLVPVDHHNPVGLSPRLSVCPSRLTSPHGFYPEPQLTYHPVGTETRSLSSKLAWLQQLLSPSAVLAWNVGCCVPTLYSEAPTDRLKSVVYTTNTILFVSIYLSVCLSSVP